MAERRHWHNVCLTMTMRQRLARLFTIKTRTEALLVTYAIAVGAIERGLHYMDQYPGHAGVVLALACLGVPFIAGAKLIDSVKAQPVAVAAPVRVMSGRRREDKRFGRRRVPFSQSARRPIPRPERRRG
jgi:hypothetical protein